MAPPIRVLAIDGGGIRGVSALLILERVMEKVRDKAGLSSTPRPCEYFDMIGGTSTGGIIAIMLGRLGMSVDECLREYMALAEQAFTPKRGFRFPKSPSGGYSATQLEEAIKKVVAKKCKEGPEALFRDHTCCKTVVLAITKRDVSGSPTLFKTYDTSDSLKDCTIWQVARATSAATTFFKSIKCGRDDIEFIDAGFGHNNPCETILSEAREIDASCIFSCILSIGTGLGRAADIRDSRLSILKALKDMATSSKRIHDSAYGRYSNTVYFRFDATVGVEGIKMDDWEESSTIAANTNNYLNSERRRIDECSEKLRALKCDGGSGETAGQSSGATGPSQVPKTTELPTNPRTVPELADNSSFDVIPFPKNKGMVQRPGLMSQLDKLLPLDDKRHEAAIWGLGGAGKTQIALDYAYRRKGAISCSVFWVHAGTEARFTDDYNKIAERAGLGANLKGRDMLQAVRQWLEKQKNWLLILDNADDIRLFVDGGTLRTFLPQASHGSVLWTSRDQEIIWSLVGKTKGVEVGKMSSEESLTLLLPNGIEVTEDQDLKLEQEAANMLVGPKGLDGLPLPISQAGTYIQKSKISVSGYVRLFQNSESKMLSIESSDSYRSGVPNSVMRTWLISMEKIREDPTAERILRTVAFFDNQGIPFELIQAAAAPESSTNTDASSDEDSMDHSETSSLDLPASDALTSATLLVRYSFLKPRQDKNKDGFPNYEQHRLIPLATQRALDKTQHRIYSKRTQDIITEVFPYVPEYSTWDLCKKYLPHALKIFSLRESEPMDSQAAELMYSVGSYHYQQGLYQEAERLHSKVVELQKSTAGERNYETMIAISHLALDFELQGNNKRAELLRVQALELCRVLVGEKHPATIISMSNLSVTWNSQGQFDKAEALLVQVLELWKAVLGEKHPDTITTMNNLAITWNYQGQFDKAEALLVQILELRKAVLGEKHPDTITTMNNLAATWNEQGQCDKAEALKEQVLELSKAVLGEKHPDTIRAMNNLAGTWYGQGHYEKAENTQVEVLKLRTEVLGAHHPHSRSAMRNLANTCQALGRVKESQKLFEEEAKLTAEWEKENSAHVVNGSYTGWAPNWQVEVEDITSTARARGWIRPKYRPRTRSVKFRWR